MFLPCPYCHQSIDCTRVTPGQEMLCPYCRGRLRLPGGPPEQQLPPAQPPPPRPAPEMRSLPPATPAASPAPPPRIKPKTDDDGFVQINPRMALLVVAGLVLLVVVILGAAFTQQETKRKAADLKRGIIPAECEFAKRMAMERVRFYLREQQEPLFNDPQWEFIESRGKYYKIYGKVRAFLGRNERWVHDYRVELRIDPSKPEGYMLHSVSVGGTSLFGNPYVDPRR